MRELVDRIGTDRIGVAFALRLNDTLNRTPRLPILFNSLVVTAVSTFEVQIARLATDFYHAHPEALDAGSSNFTLSDLKRLGSIEEATGLAISRRVDSLLYGSFADWRRFFKEETNIDFSALAIDWNATREIFQRRHTIVHNGGIASRRYVNQVAGFLGDKAPQEGSPLRSDGEYVQNALEELLTLGVLLTVSLGIKLHKRDAEHFIILLNRIAYDALVRRQWRVSEKMCSFGASISTTSADKLIFQVNRWIALSRLQGPGAVREEVLKWDISALAPRYQLAKSCLLEDMDDAFRILALLVETRDIELQDLLEWPLLEHARSDPRFDLIVLSMREQKENAKQSVSRFAITPRSKVLHILPCPRSGRASVEVTLEEAIEQGATPCKSCAPILPTPTKEIYE